jgi:glucuronate isomerase
MESSKVRFVLNMQVGWGSVPRMKKYIHADFMLDTREARTLYHDFAEQLPIVDYHCHLPPAEVAEDKRWENISQVWLYGDHYKWRAMRSNGVAERFCTGDASDRDKFEKFAGSMPYFLRNPMYHWSHLELARYFQMDDVILSAGTADLVWNRSKEVLAQPSSSARGFMLQSNVALVCTTDDPVDSLEHHKAVAADAGFSCKMLPTWRPDKVFAVHRPDFFNAWITRLGEVTGLVIDSVETLLAALQQRHDCFHAVGCRLSDYGLETVVGGAIDANLVEAIFQKVRKGEAATENERLQFQAALHDACARMDAKSDWTMQIHYGALRNNNTRLFAKLGPDAGFDSIGDWPIASGLSRFLDRLDQDDALPRTILYTLNPRDNEILGTMIGNFQGGSTPGKLQFGSGWWFNDQLDGMRRQMDALSQLGLLRRFVGMLTDSRSFLSYTRHEYFRRLLCNMLGSEMVSGLLPYDMELIGAMVADISYRNAARYFGFNLPA